MEKLEKYSIKYYLCGEKKNNIDIKQQIISWQSGKEDIKISPYKFAESRK